MRPGVRRAASGAMSVLTVLAMSACGNHGGGPAASSEKPGASCRKLADDKAWYGDNRARLDQMMTERGKCGADGDVKRGAPLALFDWDNTVVRNDTGDATFDWMVQTGKIRQPADRDWRNVSGFLTEKGASALAAACSPLAEPGQPLPTNTDTGCADELLSVYSDGKTRAGETAFQGFNARRIEPQYAMAAQVLAGWSEAEVREFASAARKQNLDAAENTKQKVGTKEVNSWVRYYAQISDLIATLKANGFDVRIISASAEPIVRVWAAELGLPDDHVMGIRTQQHDGVYTSTLEPCGDDPATITYIDGKRCRVNSEIFGVTGPAAFNVTPADKRATFAAGDSDTDVAFLTDATALRLAINRNKVELMCRAYDNADGKWLVNPMFFEPLPQRDTPYPCSTAGFIEPDGSRGPLRLDGKLVDDQKDTVF